MIEQEICISFESLQEMTIQQVLDLEEELK